MIAKISATKNLGGALGYNFKKVEKGEASILLAAELYQSNDGNYTMEDVLADIQALIPKKSRTKKTVFHCSLNPSMKSIKSNFGGIFFQLNLFVFSIVTFCERYGRLRNGFSSCVSLRVILLICGKLAVAIWGNTPNILSSREE